MSCSELPLTNSGHCQPPKWGLVMSWKPKEGSGGGWCLKEFWTATGKASILRKHKPQMRYHTTIGCKTDGTLVSWVLQLTVWSFTHLSVIHYQFWKQNEIEPYYSSSNAGEYRGDYLTTVSLCYHMANKTTGYIHYDLQWAFGIHLIIKFTHCHPSCSSYTVISFISYYYKRGSYPKMILPKSKIGNMALWPLK